MRAQPLGAQLNAHLGSVARACQRQSLVDCRFGVGPAPLPEGELCEVAVVEAEDVVLAQRGACVLEVGSRGVELATAYLDAGADGEQPVREARGDAAERGGAEPVGLVPVARRDQRLDPVRYEQRAVDPVPAYHLEPLLPHLRRLSEPAQHRQNIGEMDPCSLLADVIADLLGELHGLTKIGDTLVPAAEVGEIGATHRERSDLRLACADVASEGECLFADRQRLRKAPEHAQRPRE